MTDCPVCGLPAEIASLWKERGGARALIRCPMNHWVALNKDEIATEEL